ncbi:hypothetical protein BDI4_1240005 [Burkholderia diffusa]|nr:hypothetical protein BDI4_1240005 [Burkholderia diffusa]
MGRFVMGAVGISWGKSLSPMFAELISRFLDGLKVFYLRRGGAATKSGQPKVVHRSRCLYKQHRSKPIPKSKD